MADSEPPHIDLYFTPTDAHSRQAHEFLVRRGVEFVAHDISQDPGALNEMVRRSGQQGVPVIVIGDEVVAGFNLKRLGHLLPVSERRRIRLGVSIANVRIDGDRPEGAYVGRVNEGSPADLAGVCKGDIIIELAQRPVHRVSEVHDIAAEIRPGSKVPLTVWRAGRRFRVVLSLSPQPG